MLLLLFNPKVTSDSFVTPWTITCQPPLSMGFPRQEYWSGLPLSSPGDLPNPQMEPASPELQADYSPPSHLGSSGPISSAKEIRMKMLWAGPSGSPQLVGWGAGGTLNRQPCCRPCIIFCPISSLCALFRFLGILCLLSCSRNPNSPDWKLKSYLQSYCQDKRFVNSFLFHITSPSAHRFPLSEKSLTSSQGLWFFVSGLSDLALKFGI